MRWRTAHRRRRRRETVALLDRIVRSAVRQAMDDAMAKVVAAFWEMPIGKGRNQ